MMPDDPDTEVLLRHVQRVLNVLMWLNLGYLVILAYILVKVMP